ncbi:hypothetical protein ACI2K6_16075 [Microbacterium sp. NPDC006705]|nr:hypothetical protein [Micrococcus sp. MG-2010-D12]
MKPLGNLLGSFDSVGDFDHAVGKNENEYEYWVYLDASDPPTQDGRTVRA